jgi:hypothetical protein
MTKETEVRSARRTALDGLIRMLTGLAVLTFSSACIADAEAGPLPEPLLNCATIKRSSERLACYDRAVEVLSSGSADATSTFQPSPEAMFGTISSDPRATTSSRPEREELSSVTARITSLKRDGTGMHVIELDNGQAWHQLSGSRTLLLEEGDTVTISRAAFNSFRLSTPSGRTAKVKRIR